MTISFQGHCEQREVERDSVQATSCRSGRFHDPAGTERGQEEEDSQEIAVHVAAAEESERGADT